jgi:hypothetical protein
MLVRHKHSSGTFRYYRNWVRGSLLFFPKNPRSDLELRRDEHWTDGV